MIRQAMCPSFKLELLQGIHNFSASGDVFKIALYGPSANLSSTTTAYTATGEISGTGYTAGGMALTNIDPILSGDTAVVDFANAVWPNSSLSNVMGALIYNSSKANRAVLVLNFVSLRQTINNSFTVIFPAPDAYNAIVMVS